MAKYFRYFETQAEFESAYTGEEYVEPFVAYIEENQGVAFDKASLMGLKLKNVHVLADVPASGGTVTEADCTYTVLAVYDDFSNIDVTQGASVSGSLVVDSSMVEQRHSAGTLTLTATYSGFSDSDSVTVWQEAAEVSYLTFNITSGGDISWGYTAESGATIEYKKNDGEWTEITALPLSPKTMTGGTKINVIAGDKVYFRGDNATYCNLGIIGTFWGSTAWFTLEGNIMSLIDSVNYKEITGMTNDNNEAFMSLFEMCTGLTSAQNLVFPATILAEGCYQEMFYGCTSLTTAPELPATTLADYCYENMFDGCESLTAAPELPATTLATECYYCMFSNCTSLTSAPELPATTLTDYCYNSMFRNCTSLITAPELPATTLASSCYGNMFEECTSLTSAPELPATTLADYCYENMFYGCSSLNYIKCLATDISAANCLSSWVYGAASTGTFVKSPNMSSWPSGTSGIPTNWTVQDAS